MSDTIKFDNTGIMPDKTNSIIIPDKQSLMDTASDMLLDVRTGTAKSNSFSIPIAQLTTLGSGVSSLLPALHTVTSTTTIATDGLYRIANATDGVLKANKTGEFFWGSLKAADGTSKMAKLTAADPITATTEAVAALNPAVMMMAVALFSIEQKLGDIAETEKQILSFLEYEQESEIEADLQTLGKIITEYKHNWDNEHYVTSNHKMVLDIQRAARKNMISYQKTVADATSSKNFVVAQNKVKSAKEDLIKKFKYYRLSLFSYSMSSLLEIMLSGNFKEEYITGVKSELERHSDEYRALFDDCSRHLERLGHMSVEANVLKGVGKASDAVGKFIGKIPVLDKSPVDEWLQDGGAKIQQSAANLEYDAVGQFAKVSNPGVRVFVDKMDDMIQIYNHTAKICFDNEKIYLITG